MPDMKRKAVFDKRGRLVGAKSVKRLGSKDIDPGDLPLDGSYKLNAEGDAFIPVGHGFGKVRTMPPHSTDYVLALMVEAQGDDAPAAAREWLGWYDANLRPQEEDRK